MSISTKLGDKGQTSLWSGERIWKDDPRVEAYGTVDELNSHLGEAKHHINTEEIFLIIEKIQLELFKVAGELATKDKQYKEPVRKEDVDHLTGLVNHFENQVNLTGFVIPGSTLPSAKLDICRTIARRAERKVIALTKTENVNEVVVQYLNRLSDLLFILARILENREGKIQFKK